MSSDRCERSNYDSAVTSITSPVHSCTIAMLILLLPLMIRLDLLIKKKKKKKEKGKKKQYYELP